jgi:AraC-like DNA-binding protein
MLSIIVPLQVECKNAGVFRPRNYAKYPARRLALYQLIFVKQGHLNIAEENRAYEVGPNQTILLWPGRRHYGTKPNPLQLVYYWVYFSISPTEEGSGDLTLDVPQYATIQRPDHMVSLLHRVMDDLESRAYGGRTADLALLLALSEMALMPTKPTGTETTATFANRADALIRSAFDHEISTATIATQIGCSAGYLGRAYQKAYGINVTEAIHRRRIQHAQHLLMMGELSLEDVARDCGFQDSGYFRRIFKRRTGMTPRHYQSLNVRAAWDVATDDENT